AGSGPYWEQRYANGYNSGAGSYGRLAKFKADVINRFVSGHDVKSVIEFGCGDGNQLKLANYVQYLGFDVSETAVSSCREQFCSDETKSFRLMKEYADERADLALSLDVIYHLVENSIFEEYMATLFKASDQFVIIYSSDSDDNPRYQGIHVRHRKFSNWIAANVPHWKLREHIPNKLPYRADDREGSFADFYIYEMV
ncbi:MAG: methyltransferase domain-containing protein, partial [Methylococcales bacterium]